MSRAGRKPRVAPESMRSKPASNLSSAPICITFNIGLAAGTLTKFSRAAWPHEAILRSSHFGPLDHHLFLHPQVLLITSVLPEPGLPVFNSLGEVVVEIAEVAISLVLGLVGVILDGDVNVLDVAALEE